MTEGLAAGTGRRSERRRSDMLEPLLPARRLTEPCAATVHTHRSDDSLDQSRTLSRTRPFRLRNQGHLPGCAPSGVAGHRLRASAAREVDAMKDAAASAAQPGGDWLRNRPNEGRGELPP